MTDPARLRSQLRRILKRQLHLPMPVEAVPLDQELFDLGLSSSGAVALILDLESSFEVRFSDDHLNDETFRTGTALLETIVELSDGRA